MVTGGGVAVTHLVEVVAVVVPVKKLCVKDDLIVPKYVEQAEDKMLAGNFCRGVGTATARSA